MSDDEFDLDFVSKATNQVKTNWTNKIVDKDLKDVTNTLTTETEEIPSKRKKGKISDFMDCPKVASKNETVNKSYDNSEDDEIEVKDRKELPEISLTPPGSPTASPETKSARGTRRTKKTEQALRKINKNKGSTAALRMSQLSDIDHQEHIWRARHMSIEQTFELKVRWKDQILRVTVNPYYQMSHVTELVAKEAGVASKDLNIYKDESSEVPFALEKTVRDLQLSLVSVLSARAKVAIIEDGGVVGESGDGDGSIEIKLQTKDRRAQPVVVRIQLTDTMQTVMDRFCEQSNLDKDSVKIFFEGDQLNPKELASDLDLEGGECFDVHITEK